jgi:hypothetical protein
MITGLRSLFFAVVVFSLWGCTPATPAPGVSPDPGAGAGTTPRAATAAAPGPEATTGKLEGAGPDLGSPEGMVIKVELKDLAKAADTIIVAQVSEVKSGWNSAHTVISTQVQLKVGTAVVGSAGAGDITLTLPGGKTGELEQAVSDTPEFAVGEQVLLFLQHDATGKLLVVGGYQGKMVVMDGRVEELNAPLDAVLGQIKDLRAGQ